MLLPILAKAENARFLMATEAVCTGTYHVTVTRRSAEKIQGVVVNNQGISYRVTVWAAGRPVRAQIRATAAPFASTRSRWFCTPSDTPQTYCGVSSAILLRPGLGADHRLIHSSRRAAGRGVFPPGLAEPLLFTFSARQAVGERLKT